MKKVFIFILFFFLPIFCVKAVDQLEINFNKTRFVSGDKIVLKTNFTNVYGMDIKGILSCGFISPDPEFPPMPSMIEIYLKPGEKSETLECEMSVGDGMPSGIYKGQVEVRDQNGTTIIEREKEFIVEGTKENIEADLLLCGDPDCTERKVVFIKGEKVYLKLNTNTNNINIKADVDGKDFIFNDNKAVLNAEKEGSFIINIALQKEGFIEEGFNKNFAVIDSPANIESSSVCNIDNKCSNKETVENCPQDCFSMNTSIFNVKNIIMVIILLLGIGLIFLGYKIMKRQKD